MASSASTPSPAALSLQPTDVEAVIEALIAELDNYVFPELAEKFRPT